jgi:ornithine decarboxylase
MLYDTETDEPYYIVNMKEVEHAYERWNKCLPNIKPYYAMKCNPNASILKKLYELGCNFDCASKTEIQTILDISNDASRIIFAHPCKYPSHLIYAKDNGVDLMTFDCEEELYKIKQYHSKARILLRLAVDDSQSLCKFNIKFGCKQEDIHKLLGTAHELGLNVIGFSFHVGSGCNSAYTYYDALRICREACNIAEEKYGFHIELIDVGGGFVAHTDDPHAVQFEDIADKIKQAQYEFFDGNTVMFIGEPGRFMVQKSHTLICCVVAKKRVNDKFIYYLNDGVYGSFNCIIFDHQVPELIPVSATKSTTLYESQIFGNTCDSLDEIKHSVMLPELYVGDYMYVKNFGAYTTSAKSDSFNGYKVDRFIYSNEYGYE